MFCPVGIRHCGWIPRVLAAGLLVAAPAFAQSRSSSSTPEALGPMAQLGDELRKMGDWEPQYASIERALDRLWAEEEWNDEADLFARETASKIAAVPPWDFDKRMETLIDALQDRYALSELQTKRLEGRIYREVARLLVTNARTLFQQTREVVSARLSRRPFTPDQVARWTNETEGLFRQMRVRLERIVEEETTDFTPRQREILERDIESYRRRIKAVEELRHEWAEGRWRPEHWGMDDDPLQMMGQMNSGPIAPAVEPEPSAPADDPEKSAPPEASPTRALYTAVDETTWERYVRLFIVRYQLDEAQANSAWSIYRELHGRATDYRKLHREELADVSDDEAATAAMLWPIERLFEDLKHRLHPLPTDTQRRRAGEWTAP